MKNSLSVTMCMTSLHFIQNIYLHDEEKINKSVGNPCFRNITRCKDYTQLGYTKTIRLQSVTIIELSQLHIKYVFFKILEASPKDDVLITCIWTQVISIYPSKLIIKSQVNSNTNLEEECIALLHQSYYFEHFNAKENGIKEGNNAQHKVY